MPNRRLLGRFLVRINWSLEEMILAADAADSLEWRGVNSRTEAVVKLSRLLQQATYHPVELREDNFRSPNSVGLKVNNLRASHPTRKGAGLRTSNAELFVVELFVEDRAVMKRVATELRDRVYAGVANLGDAREVLSRQGIRVKG